MEPEIGEERGVTNRPVETEEGLKDYRPSRKDCLMGYNINIRFLAIGCLISVGCKEVPFTTIEEGMKALNDYVANPYESRKIWEERFLKEQ